MKIKNFDSAGGASPLPYKLTIHKNPLSHTNPSKNRTIPRKSPTHLPLNERSVCFASLPRQPLVPLHQIPPLSKTTINPNRKASKRIPRCLFWQWGFGLVYRFYFKYLPTSTAGAEVSGAGLPEQSSVYPPTEIPVISPLPSSVSV